MGEPKTFQLAGDPHPWPGQAGVDKATCAVMVVDMQDDYCSPGAYLSRAGYDTAPLRAPVAPIQAVLAAAHAAGVAVIYTQHTTAPERVGPETMDLLPATRGRPGWSIIDELTPAPGDIVFEKTTINAFISGELDRRLRELGIGCLAFCGNTIDVCVHSTLRSAIDLGYDCVLLSDCCGAVNEGLHAWSLESVKVEDGVFGTVATSRDFVQALAAG